MMAAETSGTPMTSTDAERIAISIRPGVSTPDWSVVTSETVLEALGAIFETFEWKERWAGLDDAQDRVRRAILEAHPRTGRSPSTDELAQSTGFAPDRVRDLIARLKARDMVVLDRGGGTLIGAYPFIDGGTEHRMRLGEKVLHPCARSTPLVRARCSPRMLRSSRRAGLAALGSVSRRATTVRPWRPFTDERGRVVGHSVFQRLRVGLFVHGHGVLL